MKRSLCCPAALPQPPLDRKMNAWKSTYVSPSRVIALSETTEEWGLQPFPSNLVAIDGYWESVRGTNNSLPASWDYCYECDTLGLRNHRIFGNSISCEDFPHNPCLIIVEGTGKNTVGPLNSSTVSVTYGVVSLFVFLITAGIMSRHLSS